jgi:hypothetical protein
LYKRDIYIQTVGLAALYAFEVDVLMAVFGGSTGLSAKGVFQGTAIIRHFMDQSAVSKGLQRPVHGYPVYFFSDLTLNITVRKRVILLQEQT